MGKILGSWSGMRKYLEEEMLHPALRGMIRYDCTAYVGMDGCRVITMFVEGKPFKRFSWETVNSFFIANGYAEKSSPMSIPEYWHGFTPLLSRVPLNQREEYTDGEFCDALTAYRNQAIGESLSSPNPIVNMFALLDRRTGVRALQRFQESMEARPKWLHALYALRMRKLNHDET